MMIVVFIATASICTLLGYGWGYAHGKETENARWLELTAGIRQ